MKAKSTTIRLSQDTYNELKTLAGDLGLSLTATLERAVAEYQRSRLFDRANAAYAALRADPQAWAEEEAERRLWGL